MCVCLFEIALVMFQKILSLVPLNLSPPDVCEQERNTEILWPVCIFLHVNEFVEV